MQSSFREQKNINALEKVRHITMAILFVVVGLLCFIADKYNVQQLLQFDKVFRYIFGAICLLYGSFRLYRGIKKS